ncbi:hypothetical protein SAMN04487995_5958 [Dyadobacter koreensis]|uniref:Uncharacterized protein n=1 Tax=Dyadobacter koreensis TaxID=408657 RepID=A0A1H7B6Y2_9BACT|nr:hypothetical protein SAMN04487995_5958 [Dyadobacter koreensis]
MPDALIRGYPRPELKVANRAVNFSISAGQDTQMLLSDFIDGNVGKGF